MLMSCLFRTKSDALRYILPLRMTADAKFPEISEKDEKLKSMGKTAVRPPIELSGSLKGRLLSFLSEIFQAGLP